HHVTNAAEIKSVRQFTTSRFIEYGKIQPSQVSDDGVPINDPYHEVAEYFACYDGTSGQIQAAARLIWSPDCTVDDLRTPADILPSASRELLESIPPGQVAELGSLSKAKGVSTVTSMKVLREVFLFAARNRIDHLVCGLEPEVYPKFKQMFGAALHRLSDEEIEFPGIIGNQVPLHIEPMRAYAEQRAQMQHRTLGERATGLMVRTFFGKEAFDKVPATGSRAGRLPDGGRLENIDF